MEETVGAEAEDQEEAMKEETVGTEAEDQAEDVGFEFLCILTDMYFKKSFMSTTELVAALPHQKVHRYVVTKICRFQSLQIVVLTFSSSLTA